MRNHHSTLYVYMVQAIKNHGDSDECLLWPFSCRTSGRHRQSRYGQIWTLDKRTEAVHRAAYALINGPIPEGAKIRHTCDITVCFNPRHLLAGTQLENIRDAIKRGRFLPKGSHHNMAKITEEQVVEMRRIFNESTGTVMGRCRHLGYIYQIHPDWVRHIVQRQAWQHI
jgi:hypothetical protein